MNSRVRKHEGEWFLSCDRTGWRAAPIAAWLITEGRKITEPTRLIDELCHRLIMSGAPLWHLAFSFQTLHPLVDACTFTWTGGRGSTEFCVLHGAEHGGTAIAEPVRRVCQTGCPVRYPLRQLDAKRDPPELHKLAAQGGVDHVVLPIAFSSGPPVVFAIATDSPSGFADADIRKFEMLTEFLAPVLEVIATRRLARTLLDTYLGRRSGSRVLDGLIRRGEGETIRAALWVSDLRDFTALSEALGLEQVLAILNAYFELTARAVTARGGEVLRFIGDAMLAIFPVEGDSATRTACGAALEAALDAFRNVAGVNQERQDADQPPIRFGVGLHVGDVLYGNVGAPDRLDFTVTGPAVNRTARLENLTKKLGVPLLMCSKFAARIDRPLRSLGRYQLSGIPKAQEVFTLAEDPGGYQ